MAWQSSVSTVTQLELPRLVSCQSISVVSGPAVEVVSPIRWSRTSRPGSVGRFTVSQRMLPRSTPSTTSNPSTQQSLGAFDAASVEILVGCLPEHHPEPPNEMRFGHESHSGNGSDVERIGESPVHLSLARRSRRVLLSPITTSAYGELIAGSHSVLVPEPGLYVSLVVDLALSGDSGKVSQAQRGVEQLGSSLGS